MTDTRNDNLLEQALEWCVLLQDPDAGPEERAGFAAWLETSEAHRQAWRRAEEVWRRLDPVAERLASGAGPSPDRLAATPAVAPVRPQALKPAFRRKTRALRALAAMLLLGAILGWRYDPAWLADYRTAVAEQREWRLEDGSLIRLAPDSALDVDYGTARRRIRLHRGEAWFRVAADPARPFVVESATGHTQALGTAFDIRRRGDRVRVLVSEHQVQVSLDRQRQRLEPGQALTYDADGFSPVRNVDVANELAWQNQRLVFQDAPLAQVLAELQRYMPGRLQLTDSTLGSLSVTAVFDTRQPRQALESLADVLALRLTRIGPWLTLVRPGETQGQQ
ncbi:FecR family protein [Azotobacter vinelandii]